jgi:myotubularin-related protein 1/2
MYNVYPSIILPKEIRHVFAFKFRKNLSGEMWSNDNLKNGWIYDARKEFLRQGVNVNDTNCKWRLSLINSGYEICDTYPQELIMPRTVNDDQIRQVAQFRSRGRIPILTWKHPTNG